MTNHLKLDDDIEVKGLVRRQKNKSLGTSVFLTAYASQTMEERGTNGTLDAEMALLTAGAVMDLSLDPIFNDIDWDFKIKDGDQLKK